MALTAPALIGSATVKGQAASSPSIVLDKPTGIQNGDYLVAAIRTNGSTSPSDFALSGWTRIGRPFVPNDAAGRVVGFYGHPVTDVNAEPASYTFTKSVADSRMAAALFVVRGVDLTSPVSGYSPGSNADAAPTIVARSFTSDAAVPQLALALFATEIVSGSSTVPVAIPAGFTEIAKVDSSASTTTTRSVIWVGYDEVSSTDIAAASLTWASYSGSETQYLTLRGSDWSESSDPGEPEPEPEEPGIPTEPTGIRLLIRGGSTAQWADANPILAAREPGYDLTTRTLKIGDGSTPWSSLPAVSGGNSVLVVADINNIPSGTPAGTIIFEAD